MRNLYLRRLYDVDDHHCSNVQLGNLLNPSSYTQCLPKGWPTRVECEMNIPEWSKALTAANLHIEFGDVLRGFISGFDQGIPHHTVLDLPFFTPENHASSFIASEKISENLKNEVEKGRMFGPYTHEEVKSVFSFFRTNPLGAVVNGDGSTRPINDLSYPRNRDDIRSVNSFVDPDQFKTTWDDFNRVANFFRCSSEVLLLALFDWEKAYRQIPTLMDQWKYLMVLSTTGELYLDTRITFGGVAGCGSFGRPADAWKKIMTSEFDLVTIFRWVDDNLFVKRTGSSTDMKDIVQRSQQLGVLTNEKKCSNFQYKQKFIGFVWNGFSKTVRLADDKLKIRISQIEDFLNPSATWSYNQVDVFVGRLSHVSYLLPQLKCYLCSLYGWKARWVHHRAKQQLPEDVREDVTFWHDTLKTFKNLRLIPIPSPTEISWVGDASDWGIGVLIGKNWIQFKASPNWRLSGSHVRTIAWLETVAIRLGLLMAIKLGFTKGCNLLVWTDNTTSQAALERRKSRDKEVNSEWKIIQQLLIDNQIDLTPRRVISEDNIADKLSRGSRETVLLDGTKTKHELVDMIQIEVPSDLLDVLSMVASTR